MEKKKLKKILYYGFFLAKEGIQINGIKECLMSWRKNSKSLSASNIQKIIDGYKVYKDYLNYSRIKSLFFLIILSFNFIIKNIQNEFLLYLFILVIILLMINNFLLSKNFLI